MAFTWTDDYGITWDYEILETNHDLSDNLDRPFAMAYDNRTQTWVACGSSPKETHEGPIEVNIWRANNSDMHTWTKSTIGTVEPTYNTDLGPGFPAPISTIVSDHRGRLLVMTNNFGDEGGPQMKAWTSTDGGDTWTDEGQPSFPEGPYWTHTWFAPQHSIFDYVPKIKKYMTSMFAASLEGAQWPLMFSDDGITWENGFIPADYPGDIQYKYSFAAELTGEEVPPLRQLQRDDSFGSPRVGLSVSNHASSEQESVRVVGSTYL